MAALRGGTGRPIFRSRPIASGVWVVRAPAPLRDDRRSRLRLPGPIARPRAGARQRRRYGRRRLARIDAPTLVLWGDSDRIVSPDYGRAYADAIPGARFQSIPAAGHYPYLEQPEAFVAAVSAFLRED